MTRTSRAPHSGETHLPGPLTGFAVGHGRVTVRGVLLGPIFENQFAVAVRDVHGRVLVRRTVAAWPGGQWRVRLR